MKLDPIHQSPEQVLAANSDKTLAAIHENTAKMDSVVQAVSSISYANDYSGVIRKLEEIKSAILATNLILRRAENKEPIISIDATETNRLLTEVLTELKKPLKASVKLT